MLWERVVILRDRGRAVGGLDAEAEDKKLDDDGMSSAAATTDREGIIEEAVPSARPTSNTDIVLVRAVWLYICI